MNKKQKKAALKKVSREIGFKGEINEEVEKALKRKMFLISPRNASKLWDEEDIEDDDE